MEISFKHMDSYTEYTGDDYPISRYPLFLSLSPRETFAIQHISHATYSFIALSVSELM